MRNRKCSDMEGGRRDGQGADERGAGQGRTVPGPAANHAIIDCNCRASNCTRSILCRTFLPPSASRFIHISHRGEHLRPSSPWSPLQQEPASRASKRRVDSDVDISTIVQQTSAGRQARKAEMERGSEGASGVDFCAGCARAPRSAYRGDRARDGE